MQAKSGTYRAVFLGLCHERGVDFTGSMKDVTQETVTARLNQHCPVRFLHEQFPGFVDSACQADRVAFVIH